MAATIIPFPQKTQVKTVYRLRLVLDATPDSEDLPPFGQVAGVADVYLGDMYSFEEAEQAFRVAAKTTRASVGFEPERLE